MRTKSLGKQTQGFFISVRLLVYIFKQQMKFVVRRICFLTSRLRHLFTSFDDDVKVKR